MSGTRISFLTACPIPTSPCFSFRAQAGNKPSFIQLSLNQEKEKKKEKKEKKRTPTSAHPTRLDRMLQVQTPNSKVQPRKSEIQTPKSNVPSPIKVWRTPSAPTCEYRSHDVMIGPAPPRPAGQAALPDLDCARWRTLPSTTKFLTTPISNSISISRTKSQRAATGTNKHNQL